MGEMRGMGWRAASAAAAVAVWCGPSVMAAETQPMRLASSSKPRATAADIKKAAASKTAAAVQAAPALQPEVKVVRKVVEGQVVHLSKRAISVEYEAKGGESNEMLLPLGSTATVEGVSSLSELKQGDRVKVGIEQTYQDLPNGEQAILKTEALVVVLVQHAAEAAMPKSGATAVR